MVRAGSGPRNAEGAAARPVSRDSLEKGSGAPLPRMICLVGGDPVLASELAERLADRAVPGGVEGFNQEVVFAPELKLRDLASRVEELPLLASERVIVVRGAEALLKHSQDELQQLWPRPDSSTVLLLVAAEEESRAARKGARSWAEVLPPHGVRVEVGGPTREDALRWGRAAALAAGLEVDEKVWLSAHRRARGDGARLRTDIELALLAALSGRSGAARETEPEQTLDEAATRVRELLRGGDWKSLWIAAEQYRAQGGSMDSRGAEWVRAVAELLQQAEQPEAVGALRALSTLQLRWRREVGTARQVLERSALELVHTRLRRETGRKGR